MKDAPVLVKLLFYKLSKTLNDFKNVCEYPRIRRFCTTVTPGKQPETSKTLDMKRGPQVAEAGPFQARHVPSTEHSENIILIKILSFYKRTYDFVNFL